MHGVSIYCRTGTGAGAGVEDRVQDALEASPGAAEAIGLVSTAVTPLGHATSTLLFHMPRPRQHLMREHVEDTSDRHTVNRKHAVIPCSEMPLHCYHKRHPILLCST